MRFVTLLAVFTLCLGWATPSYLEAQARLHVASPSLSPDSANVLAPGPDVETPGRGDLVGAAIAGSAVGFTGGALVSLFGIDDVGNLVRISRLSAAATSALFVGAAGKRYGLSPVEAALLSGLGTFAGFGVAQLAPEEHVQGLAYVVSWLGVFSLTHGLVTGLGANALVSRRVQ